jgi:minor curlin subunit
MVWQKGHKMKKIINIVFVVFLTASQFIFSQQENSKTEEAFLQQIQSLVPIANSVDGLDFSNKAQIQQNGNGNDASINQTLTGINALGNVAELIQNGNINDATLTQSGSGNIHSITQHGKGNMFEASVIGDNNSSTIGQYGNENIINQDLVGNDMSFILTQRGNNNEISQTENDQQSRQYEIIQNGDGMKLIIINGGILP